VRTGHRATGFCLTAPKGAVLGVQAVLPAVLCFLFHEVENKTAFLNAVMKT